MGASVIRLVKVLAVLVPALGLFVIVWLGALGQPPFSGTNVEWVVLFIVIVVLSMVIGTLGGGAVIEFVYKTWTKFRWWHYAWMIATGVAALALAVFFFWWLFSSTAGASSRWWFLFGSLVAIAAGVLLAWYPLRLPPAIAERLPAGIQRPRRALWPHTRSPAGEDWTPSTVLWSVLGVCIGIITAVGYVGISAWHENASVPPGPALPAAPTDIHGGYLALGDSYSAGEGLTPFESATVQTHCDRSANPTSPAYPTVLAGMLKLTPGQFFFTACADAVVADVLHPVNRSGIIVPPQVDPQQDAGVGLVTLTIGGNNAIFANVVQSCLIAGNCFTEQFPPAGVAERTAVHVPQGLLKSQWGPQTIEEVGTEDAAVFAVLRKDFPSARIVVIGYPYLFPATASPGFPFYPPMCASVLNRLSQPERQDMRGLQDELTNRTYEEAVAAGIEFVSPDAIWGEHTPCGAAGQYTNSVKPYLNFPNPINGGSFHPNAAGQQALAALVACYLDANPQPPSPYLPGRPHTLVLPPSDRLVSPAQLGLVAAPGMASVPGHGTVPHC